MAALASRRTGHTLSLSYTSDDDGIHLNCSCDTTEPVARIGYFPTLHDVAVAVDKHLKETP